MSHGWQGYGLRYGPIATASTDENSWYGLHFVGFGDSALKQVEWQPAYGFAARPVDGTATEACNGFFSLDGEFAWCGHDARYSSKCPPLTSGSCAQWNNRGQFDLLDASEDTKTIYVPVAFDSGGTPTAAHLVQVGIDSNGKKVIDIRHADGMAIVMLEESISIKNKNGDAFITLNKDGAIINGNTKLVGAADIGGTGAQPLINATAFAAWWGALTAAVGGVATPITGTALAALMETAGQGLTATNTLLLKGL